MKNVITILNVACLIFIQSCTKTTSNDLRLEPTNQSTITIFDNILFYNGYGTVSKAPVPENVYRINNSLYVKKFSDFELDKVGSNLQIEIAIKADCDNYDRIGRVYLSLIKKGSSYNEETASNIEIGRFITPFMDKNKTPNEVLYRFSVVNLSKLIQDKSIRKEYDIWIGFSIFGSNSAGQNEVMGCKGVNSTFFGSLKFNSQSDSLFSNEHFKIISLSYMKKDGDGNNNELNYTNKTILGAEKTIDFTLNEPLKDTKLYLITSSHGAGENGEEYNRRFHKVYVDNQLKWTFIPGGKSCEPFRDYNTQANLIYGNTKKPDVYWTSWNNWCPGDVIPIREINLGDLKAGKHSFKIVVEGARFVNNTGYIPISAYLQGKS